MLRSSARSLRRHAPWRVVRTAHTDQGPKQTSTSRTVATHLAAAAAGGAAVLLAGYAYYHYSGLASLVARARVAATRYNEVRTAWRAGRPHTSSEAITFLRGLSRSRRGPVPDTFVDMVAQFQGDHEEDIDRIVFGACDDIQAVLGESRAAGEDVGEQGLTEEERGQIRAIVQTRAGELKEKMKARLVLRVSNDEKGAVRGVVARWRTKHDQTAQGSLEDDEKL